MTTPALPPRRSRLRTRSRCRTLAVAFCFFASPGPASADPETPWVAFVPSYFTPGVSGDIALGGPGNTKLDADDILDLESDGRFVGDLELHVGRHHLRLRALPFAFSGRQPLPTGVTVLGIPFVAGNVAASDLEIDTLRLAYRYDAISTGMFRLSPVFEIAYVDAEFHLSNLSVPGAAVRDDLRAPLPLLGVHAQLTPHERWRFFVEAAGFAAGSWDDLNDAHIFDAEAGVSFALREHAWLTAAWRDTAFRFESGISEFDMALDGLSLRVEMRFP